MASSRSKTKPALKTDHDVPLVLNEGDVAPDFDATGWRTSSALESVRKYQFKEKTVVLSFFQSAFSARCSAQLREMDFLARIAALTWTKDENPSEKMLFLTARLSSHTELKKNSPSRFSIASFRRKLRHT